MTTTVNINSSLKINVTPIEDGTSGGILFQKSDGKLGQSSNLHWNDTNSRLSIGQGDAPGARLDVRLPGALSSDLGARFRNSSNNRDLFKVVGNGAHFDVAGGSGFDTVFSISRAGTVLYGVHEYGQYFSGPVYINNIAGSGISPISFSNQSGNGSSITLAPINAASGLKRGPIAPSAPTANTNTAWRYAALEGGVTINSFMNGNGNIIKLFRGASLTASDGTLANAVTRIAELEARLQAHGLIA